MVRGAHTFKFGGEYRNISSEFQFLGSTEITYTDINAFIDNRPTQVAISQESPLFTPQQFYMIGFAQDSWRVHDRVTLELGFRYDFYSVVNEKDNRAKPFFIEENNFDPDPDNFYNPDRNNISPRLSAVFQLDDRTALRAGYGHFYGPGQFEDRIQPIENFIERHRVQSTDVPKRARLPGGSGDRIAICCRFADTRTNGRMNTTCSTASACRASSQGPINLTVGYTGSNGKRHVPARRGQHIRQRHARAAESDGRAGRLQDIKLSGWPDHQRQRHPAAAAGPPTTRCRLAPRADSIRVSVAGFSTSTRATGARRRDPTKPLQRRIRSITRLNTARIQRTSRTASTGRWSTCCPSMDRWQADGAWAAS